MNKVSDQGEIVRKWEAGFKVYYINTKGITNKKINNYLKLLADKKTLNPKYKVTNKIKKELYEIGGSVMSKEMEEILRNERAEGVQQGMQQGMQQGKISAFIEMVKSKVITIADAASSLNMSETEFASLVK